MKKVYNIILILLIIATIIVASLIIIKYGRNKINEGKIETTINEIEDDFNNNEIIDKYYNGYKIDGIIEIPKINIKYPILNKTDDESMKISITKFWGPEINTIGNYTVAGHNNRDGTMFGNTKKLNIGDEIKLTDLNDNTIVYTIFKIYLIDPDDTSCIESIQNDTKEVTLITCTNGHKNRLIIKARENI